MIGSLSGYISFFEDHVLIDVSGVGYLVFCSAKTLSNLHEHSLSKLFIQTHVREDQITLYGFLSLEEKCVFNLLQSVNGIGPKMALAILSSLSPQQIFNAIKSKDKDIFCCVSGVGPRVAERILIELKNKIPKSTLNDNICYDQANQSLHDSYRSDKLADSISALVNLGKTKQEAEYIVNVILKNNPEIAADDLIKEAIKRSYSK